MSLKSLGEFGLIHQLTKRIPRQKGALRLGIGDDCAVIRSTQTEDLLVTTDMLIEGIHFRRDWSTMIQIGRKAMLVNLSDISAMGGIPRYAVVAAGLPGLGVKEVKSLYRGLNAIAHQAGVVIIGGDTVRAPRLVLNITLIGVVERGRGLTRSGAKIGDQIFVTGHLGIAAVHLSQKQHWEPPYRGSVGRALIRQKLAHSAIDISDGFLADLGHILEESGVGAQIEADRLPGKAPQHLKLSGGEDYELLFTVPPRVKIRNNIHGVPVTRVGKIVPLKEGVRLVDQGGKRLPLPRRRGYTHF